MTSDLEECASDLAQSEGLLLNRVGGKWAFWLTIQLHPVASFVGDTVAEVVGAMRVELERRRNLQVSLHSDPEWMRDTPLTLEQATTRTPDFCRCVNLAIGETNCPICGGKR